MTEFTLAGNKQTDNQTLTLLGSGQATVTSGAISPTACTTGNYAVKSTFQISPSGAFMGDNTAYYGTPPNTTDCASQLSVGGFLGMKAPSGPVDAGSSNTGSLFGSNRTFRGVLFRQKSQSGDAPFTEEIYATITQGVTTLAGGNYTDVSNNIVQNPLPVAISLGKQASDPSSSYYDNTNPYYGVFPEATILLSPDSFPAVFMVNQIGGKYFLFGFSNTNQGGGDYPSNLLLMEQ